jgi:hypothetical protein
VPIDETGEKLPLLLFGVRNYNKNTHIYAYVRMN